MNRHRILALLLACLPTPWLSAQETGGERLKDAGFEALAEGVLQQAAAPGVWGVPAGDALGFGLTVKKTFAHSGERGVSGQRKNRGPLVQQIVPALAPGLYELTVWARGKGNVILAVDSNSRRLALGTDWQPFSLVFPVSATHDAVVSFEAESQAEWDDASLRPADAERQAAWKKQEDAQAQFGFVPAGASGQRPAPGSAAAPAWNPGMGKIEWLDKAVFFDPAYSSAWITNPGAVCPYLQAQGFRLLDAEALAVWMQNHLEKTAPGSVVIMTMGMVPATVFPANSGRDSLIMRYLRAGGRVLWLGELPLVYTQEKGKNLSGCEPYYTESLEIRGGHTSRCWNYTGTNHSKVTPLGQRWGARTPGGNQRSAYVDDVTAALSSYYSEDTQAELTEVWFKNYAPEQPWSGLIFALRGADLAVPKVQEEVYRLALYAGEPVTAPPAKTVTVEEPACVLTLTLGEPGNRSNYLRGETIPVTVTQRLTRKTAQPQRILLGLFLDDKPAASQAFDAGPADLKWPVATTDLACGDYRLRAEAWDGTNLLGYAERSVGICPQKAPPTFFFGAWPPSLGHPADRAKTLQTMADLGLNPGCCTPEILDDCLKYGLFAAIRVHGNPQGPFEPGSNQVAPDGTPYGSAWTAGRPITSLGSAVYRQQTGDSIAKQLAELRGYPALWPWAHTNDDFSISYGPDYSELAKKLFKAKTGLDAQTTPEMIKLGIGARQALAHARRPAGIIPENDPWLQWASFTTKDLAGGFNRAQMEGAERGLPGVRLGPVPGGMMMPLWIPGQYPPHHFGKDAFNLIQFYYYNNYWQPPIAATFLDEVGRLNNRDLPVWVVSGLYCKDEPTYYRNLFYLDLAGGVQGLNYFTYEDGVKRPRGLAEIGRIGNAVVKPFYPFLGTLRPARHTVGLLLPFTQAMTDTGYPFQAAYAYANLVGAKIDVEPTCEEEVMNGDALPYKAILLWHVKWLRQAAYDGLLRFIAKGGKVLADASTEVEIPGAVRLPVDLGMGAGKKSTTNNEDARFGYPGIQDYLVPERVKAIRDALQPHLEPVFDSPAQDLLVRRAQAGGVNYLWLVNIHTGDDYLYIRPRVGAGAKPTDPQKADEEHVAYLAEKVARSQNVFAPTVALALPAGTVLYDVLKGGEIPAAPEGQRQKFTARMEILGGQLVALYPQRLAKIEVKVPGELTRGQAVPLQITVRGADGKPMPGGQPLRVTVAHAQGTFSEWTGSYVTVNGALEIPLRPAVNHPRGYWNIRVEELSSRLTAEISVWVK